MMGVREGGAVKGVTHKECTNYVHYKERKCLQEKVSKFKMDDMERKNKIPHNTYTVGVCRLSIWYNYVQ